MLKKVILDNFQSHEHSEFELKPHMNVVYGVSDSGKSAIRKGIQAVLNRAPFYLRWGVLEGKVTLEFDDCTVSREYKRSKNTKCPSCKEKVDDVTYTCESCGEILPVKVAHDRYLLNGEVFEKFGTELPPMLTEKMRLGEIAFGDISINLNVATQFEDMFFIGTSYNGTKRNKMISGLVPDSDRVDTLVKEMNSEKNDLRAQVKVMQREYDDNSSKIDLVEKDIEELTELHEKIESLETNLGQMKLELAALIKFKQVSETIKFQDKIKTFLEKYSNSMEKAGTVITTFERLSGKLISWKVCKENIQVLKLRTVEIPELESPTFAVLDFEKMFNDHLALKNIKRDVVALTLINTELPELLGEKIANQIEVVDGLLKKTSTITAIKQSHEKLKLLADELFKDGEKLKKAQEILFVNFKTENPELICPHRKDVYADECLEKFSK